MLNQQMHTDPIYAIAESEQRYTQQLTRIALDILKHRKEKPILLLSGPSGSGKTTSALRIEQLLEGWGCAAMVLSMDNYYLPESQTPQALNEHGVVDYESPYRLDIPLLNEHLERLSRCEPIQLPVFNFAKQCREPAGHRQCRRLCLLHLCQRPHTAPGRRRRSAASLQDPAHAPSDAGSVFPGQGAGGHLPAV